MTIGNDISSQIGGRIQRSQSEVNQDSSYQRKYSLRMHANTNNIESFHCVKIVTISVISWGVGIMIIVIVFG